MNRLMMMRLLEAAQNTFVVKDNLVKLIGTALLSMVPMYEGRYAMPVMIGLGLPAGLAWLIAVVFSTLPMPIILLFLRPVLDWFYTLPIGFVRRFAAWLERHSEKKRKGMFSGNGKGVRGYLAKHLSGETLELLGLYIFVALPLPGTGCWTGSAVAALFKMDRKKAALAITLGNMTACAITLAISMGAKAVV